MSFNTEANGNHKTNRKRKKIYGWDTGCWRASTSHYKFLALWRGHHEQIHMNMNKSAHSGHASEWSNLTETQESLDDVVLVEAERNVTGLLNQVCNS